MDRIIRAIAADNFIKMSVIDAKDTVQRAVDIHHPSVTASAALGRALCAASLLGNMLKEDDGSVTLRINGGGPAGTIIAVSDSEGNVRGFMNNPQADLPSREDGKLDVGGLVGTDGLLTVSRDLGLKEPYVGSTELVSGEIAEDLTSFLVNSDQVPSACGLGVLVDPDGSIRAAGGFLVQLMPFAPEETISKLEDNIFFMVKAIDVKTGSNNKQYLDLLLSDKTGEITGKKWDITDEEIQKLSAVKTGSLVKIKAQVTEWNGMKQFRVFRIRGAMEQDGLDTSDYVKAAPEDPREMYDFIMGKAQALGDEDLKKLCVSVLQDNEEKLLYYPAAQKNHHAEFAGLLWHMKRMVMNGEGICRVYTILDPDLVTAGVILHDIEKIREIRSNDMGISDGYSMEGMMLGHIVQGVRELDSRMKDLGFSDEKRIMIEHMILSHHYEPEFGSPRKPMFPEAEILHYLDIIDARMFDMEEALDGTKPGEFSDRIWTLDNRKLYKKSE